MLRREIVFKMQLLPTEILDWVNWKDFNIDIYSINCPIDCFLEDDLDHTNELHNLLKKEVTEEMLSKYQLQMIEYVNFSFRKIKQTYA